MFISVKLLAKYVIIINAPLTRFSKVSSHASAKISLVGAFPCLPYAFLN